MTEIQSLVGGFIGRHAEPFIVPEPPPAEHMNQAASNAPQPEVVDQQPVEKEENEKGPDADSSDAAPMDLEMEVPLQIWARFLGFARPSQIA